MVAHERIKRAETEDELRESQQEKEALRSALKILEGENGRLRIMEEDVERRKVEGRRAIDLRPSDGDADEVEVEERRSAIEIRDLDAAPHAADPSRSRSSSEVGTKSPVPISATLEPEDEGKEQEVQPLPQPESEPHFPLNAEAADEALDNIAEVHPAEASAFLSPPEPNFKPSTPRNYILEERSPWA